ncbi:MAG TPA: ImmA/IrrE family metallo-endopeptidase [Thermoanaerobaculia bacterium]|nr:ImmA/IrrE family metallo-endopeptidase [Thermoanaerobaculia bacterium]
MRRLLGACNASLVERPIATEGRLELGRKSFSVSIRPGPGWRRQRFTIAHEIGHILVLQTLRQVNRIQLLRQPSAWRVVEGLCNAFAAELLMPRADTLESLKKFGFSLDGLRYLYDRYLTSHLALYIRLKQVIPGATITLWCRQVRHEGDRAALRVVKCYRSHHGPWLPLGLSSRYLEPDVVSEACETGFSSSLHLNLKIRGRELSPAVLAAPASSREERSASQLPIFDGLTVPDERRCVDAVVLLLEPTTTRRLAGDIWNSLFPRDSQPPVPHDEEKMAQLQ